MEKRAIKNQPRRHVGVIVGAALLLAGAFSVTTIVSCGDGDFADCVNLCEANYVCASFDLGKCITDCNDYADRSSDARRHVEACSYCMDQIQCVELEQCAIPCEGLIDIEVSD